MGTQYRFERIDKTKLGDIRFLYQNAFNISISLKELSKKYDTSKFGNQSYLGYIAYSENNTPAAYYGVFPCYVKYQENAILAAQSGDTMTHSEHRGQGLFVTLAKMTYDLAKENGVKFIFGFPNKNSYHGFVKKLNWIHTENIKSYKVQIATIPISKIAKKVKLLTPAYSFYTSSILSIWASKRRYFTNSNIDSIYGGILRNEDFFEYKKYTKNKLIEICQTCVWIKIDSVLNIGDIERNPQHFSQILSKLKRIAFILGCPEITFNCSPNTYIDSMLSGKYPFKEILPIGYLDLGSGLDINKIRFSGGDFDTF